MYSEFLALFAALAATVLANDGDATYNQGDMVAVGACADKHPVRTASIDVVERSQLTTKLTCLSPQVVPAGHYSTAISTVIWDDSAHCGKVVNVHGPNGATIPVVVSFAPIKDLLRYFLSPACGGRWWIAVWDAQPTASTCLWTGSRNSPIFPRGGSPSPGSGFRVGSLSGNFICGVRSSMRTCNTSASLP